MLRLMKLKQSFSGTGVKLREALPIAKQAYETEVQASINQVGLWLSTSFCRVTSPLHMLCSKP